MANFLSRLFNEDARRLKKIENRIQPVLDLEQKYRQMSDSELQGKTAELKQRLKNGESEDDIFTDAFATAREACRRVPHTDQADAYFKNKVGVDWDHYQDEFAKGDSTHLAAYEEYEKDDSPEAGREFPFPVQLMGAAVLHDGDIAEMKTGEGKTLTSVMAVYLNALAGQGVHVVTVNEYLSARDEKWMGRIYRWLGLSVGLNLRQFNRAQKRAAYASDITYTTNSELGFDYLRDNMVTRVEDRVMRGMNFALVDEVDSILIDESRTPLIISGGQRQTANLYLQADRFAKHLTKDEDYEVDPKSRTVQLTEQGVSKAEKVFHIDNLYNLTHTQLLHHINQALKANYIMAADIDYMVDTENDEIVIIDPNTGRLMKGRQWSDGLHQAIEAKEGISIKQETTTLATITYQNFFRLYNKLAGMTGTAKTEEEEFLEIYNMYVVEIPTNKPVIRIDYPDAVFGTKKAKFKALVDEVEERHAKGQPILVGTIAVETSELISKYLDERHIPHNVLNAKNHQLEANIIAHAGEKGAVTIATNMAGRGTDIKLGPGVRELGGLCVLGSERHESRRIDNQLRGRAGRQGDPGMSRFYVSVQDDLMIRFGSERMEGLFASLGDTAVESKAVTKSISAAQRRVEGVNYDARKQLLQYDDVMRQQRETIYKERDYILENSDVHEVIEDMFKRVVSDMVASHVDPQSRNEEVDTAGLIEGLKQIGFRDLIQPDDIEGKSREQVIELVNEKAWTYYQNKIEPVKDKIQPIEKEVSLRTIDRAWSNHIDTMSKLRDGIGLRGYAQSNPLQAYVQEGYQLFEDMMRTISQEIVSFCMNVKVVPAGQAEKEA